MKTKTLAAKKTTGKKEDVCKEMKLKPAEIRFVYLYLGGEDGECWNNATRAYAVAFEKDINDPKQYATSRSEGSRILTKPNIQKYRDDLLLSIGYDPENIKKRYSEIASQNKDIRTALQANDRVAKIAGVLRDDPTKVNIPELEAVANAIKSLLG